VFKFPPLIGILFVKLLLFSTSCKSEQTPPVQSGPNIVLIVADDLGFSDLGCFGSEIATPNIDALASQGQIFSNFYAAATCSPTRAMLLSGTDNHMAGLGDMAERVQSMPELIGQPGYEGYLNDRVISIAQLLKDTGYHTYIAGKWHLGRTPDQSPKAKGFERSYTLLDAYTNHFYPYRDHRFWEDDGYTQYPEGQYSTNLYTDKLISFIDGDREDNQPFFLFAAYTSPHWPLQAPPEHIDKYHGKYHIGYDSLRVLRFQGLKDRQIIPRNTALPELPAVKGNLYRISSDPLTPWTVLDAEQKRIEARKMEIYAGMVDNLDYNIGRLVDHLKQIGQFDNTLFVFLSDNGSAVLDNNMTPDGVDMYEAMGTANSFVGYGPPWAHASSAAFRLYKGYSTEGGIHTPLIVKMPNQQLGKGVTPAFTTVMDLAPTFLELAGGTYPSSYKGRPLEPHKGESMLPLLKGEQNHVHAEEYSVGWELFGRCALRKGNWKITKVEAPFGKGRFELFNLEEDPTEQKDLAQVYPGKYTEMLQDWDNYVEKNGVILLDR
jgi:arylsulfatase A-like enzyme